MKAMHSRLLKSYVLSYASIALLACAIIGLSLFYIATSQLNSAMLQSKQKELTLAANDLEHQYEIMRDIAYGVSTSIYYRSIYLDGGISRLMRMQEDFAKYEGYSPIVTSYFFYRTGDRLVWKPNAANTLEVYARSVLNTQDDRAFFDILDELRGDGAAISRLNASNVALLFPIHTDSNRSMHNDAVVGFILNKTVLLRRLEDVTAGQAEFPLYIYYIGEPLFSLSDSSAPAYETLAFTDAGVLEQYGGLLGSRSPDGLFTLAVEIDAVGINETLAYFRTVSMLVIIISLVMLILLGYIVARHNYRPISELAKKYGIGAGSENEIMRIDTALHSALEQNRLSESRLSEQLNTLRQQRDVLIQQFLLLVLNGQYQADAEARALELGIAASGRNYCAYAVSAEPMKGCERERLFQLIHDLSDETMSCHCVKLKTEDTFAVIVSAGEDAQFAEVMDLMEALGGAEGVCLGISQGKPCEDIRSLPASLAYALRKNCETEIAMADTDGVIDKTAAAQIVVALRRGDLDQAQDRLDAFADGLRQRKLPFSSYYYEFANLLISLTRATEDLNAPQIRQRAGVILQSGSISEFQCGISDMLGELHVLMQEYDSESNSRTRTAVMDYIRSHATDYDMGLNKLASEFSLSVKYLRHIVKTETGRNLREYINLLRVERAKEWLTDGERSISAVAQSVGYLSVSYFIKNFRTITGVTPANYRRVEPAGLRHAPDPSYPAMKIMKMP